MIDALNPRRYRVEHLFDVSEALLRAELVLAHCLVVHATDDDDTILKHCASCSQRVSLVLVSRHSRVREFARQAGARFASEPITTTAFKQAVLHAVADAQTHRRKTPSELEQVESAENAAPKVLLLARDPGHSTVMAAVFKGELAIRCDVASNAAEALVKLHAGIDCLVADPELLMTHDDGVAMARELASIGVPVIPLATAGTIDDASAGQIAWDIVPQIRRCLAARLKSAAGS